MSLGVYRDCLQTFEHEHTHTQIYIQASCHGPLISSSLVLVLCCTDTDTGHVINMGVKAGD